MRHRNLGGYAHNMASFYAQRRGGFLTASLNSIAGRTGIETATFDLLSGEVAPSKMDRLLTKRLVEYGQECLMKVIPNSSEASPVKEHLASAIIEFHLSPSFSTISATLEDHFGHTETRTVRVPNESPEPTRSRPAMSVEKPQNGSGEPSP